MHHGAGIEASVDAEMQAKLRARGEVAGNVLAIEVDNRHLLRLQRRQRATGRADRDVVAAARADVAGGAGDEAVCRQCAARGGDLLTLLVEHEAGIYAIAGDRR
jgi:hypothetical protein